MIECLGTDAVFNEDVNDSDICLASHYIDLVFVN